MMGGLGGYGHRFRPGQQNLSHRVTNYAHGTVYGKWTSACNRLGRRVAILMWMLDKCLDKME
jgi:hypothetical protein